MVESARTLHAETAWVVRLVKPRPNGVSRQDSSIVGIFRYFNEKGGGESKLGGRDYEQGPLVLVSKMKNFL